MANAGPEVYWRWLELHDSVSMVSVERKFRTAAGTRQWRIHRRPKPRHSLLDERRLHYAAWQGCLEQVRAMVGHGVPANCQLVSYKLKRTIHPTFSILPLSFLPNVIPNVIFGYTFSLVAWTDKYNIQMSKTGSKGLKRP